MPIYKTNRRKDGKQQYRVVVNYTTGDGRHRTMERIVYGYDAARDTEMHLKMRCGAKLAELGQLSMDDFFVEYQRYKAAENRQSSVEKASCIYRNHIQATLGAIRISEITPPMIMHWKQVMNEKSLATVTKNHAFSILRSIINHAALVGAIHDNPIKGVKEFHDPDWKMPEQKLQYYTPDEWIQYASTARSLCQTFYQWSIFVFFCIAYYTGLRKGEIHALRWDDYADGLLHVRKSISLRQGQCIETPPKNKSSYRSVQVPIALQLVLTENRQRQISEYGNCNRQMFIVRGNSCISNSALTNYNFLWAQAANLHHIRIHDFRHSHASVLANHGIHMQEIAKRLGHTSTHEVETRYAHLYPTESERALNVLNKILLAP